MTANGQISLYLLEIIVPLNGALAIHLFIHVICTTLCVCWRAMLFCLLTFYDMK